jgi:asparagine synthase (glutamine-hydrolysing)
MCGIAGVLRFDGQPVSTADMADVADQLGHRGRDASRVLSGSGGPLSQTGCVALAHRRLSIIDLSEAASQPMANAEGTLWVCFNGEIYNYIELRHELRNGYQFRTHSDTEVILAAYERWGERCVEHFNGMFALALWDDHRQTLFFARDHFGIKPLYFVSSPRFVAFASESRALKAYHGNALSTRGLMSYLMSSYVPGDWSIFEGVRKLPPAHTMTVTASGKIKLRRYWHLDNVGRDGDTGAGRQALLATLTNAIARQLRSDVPVGALLSGGIDSAMIVALAARQGSSLRTYSAGYEGLDVDEAPAAAAIASACNTEHTTAVITAADSINILDTSIARLTEPIADSAIVASYVLADAAASDGVKVLLSGTGGDEVFAGYERYFGNNNVTRRVLSATPPAIRRLLGKLLPESSQIGARLRNMYVDLLLNTGGDFALAMSMLEGDHERVPHLRALVAAMPQSRRNRVPVLYQQMMFDLKFYLPDQLLLLLDQMTMAHTVEGRVPLIDVELVEAAYRFPPSAHASHHGTKLLFRDLATPFLGADHARRRKQGFGGPVPWWVRNNASRVRDGAIAAAAIPGLERLKPELNRLCSASGPATGRDSHVLFLLYCLSHWYNSLD